MILHVGSLQRPRHPSPSPRRDLQLGRRPPDGIPRPEAQLLQPRRGDEGQGREEAGGGQAGRLPARSGAGDAAEALSRKSKILFFQCITFSCTVVFFFDLKLYVLFFRAATALRCPA